MLDLQLKAAVFVLNVATEIHYSNLTFKFRTWPDCNCLLFIVLLFALIGASLKF